MNIMMLLTQHHDDALRTGLAIDNQVKALPPFTIDRAHLIRLKPGYHYDKVEEVFDHLDTPRRLR